MESSAESPARRSSSGRVLPQCTCWPGADYRLSSPRDSPDVARTRHDHTQYNVLQALHCGLAGGLTCSELGSRLAGTDPDITRLLDRLAKQGLVRDIATARPPRRADRDHRRRHAPAGFRRAAAGCAYPNAVWSHGAEARLQLLIDLLNEAMPAPKRNGERAPQPVPTAKPDEWHTHSKTKREAGWPPFAV